MNKVSMKRRECSSSSTSAAIEDMREFMNYQLELFKVETEEMLARMIKQVKESAAEDSAKKRKKKKAERMRKTAGQTQSKKNSTHQSEPQQHRADSSSRNCINPPLNDVRAGSTMDAVSNDLEAEQERNGSISSNNEGENEKEVEDAAELEDLSAVNGRRKSRRTIQEPAWMNDFMTV